MAIQISKTIGELFAYSGGASCREVYNRLDAVLPGWTEDTVVDALAYLEDMRSIGQAGNANRGLYFALTAPMRLNFMAWALDQIILATPGSYTRKPAMVQLRADLADYVAAPTAQKRNAILATAKAIKPNTSIPAELFVGNAFKAVAKAIANNTVDGLVITELAKNLRHAGVALAGLSLAQIDDAILTQLEKIIGVID